MTLQDREIQDNKFFQKVHRGTSFFIQIHLNRQKFIFKQDFVVKNVPILRIGQSQVSFSAKVCQLRFLGFGPDQPKFYWLHHKI